MTARNKIPTVTSIFSILPGSTTLCTGDAMTSDAGYRHWRHYVYNIRKASISHWREVVIVVIILTGRFSRSRVQCKSRWVRLLHLLEERRKGKLSSFTNENGNVWVDSDTMGAVYSFRDYARCVMLVQHGCDRLTSVIASCTARTGVLWYGRCCSVVLLMPLSLCSVSQCVPIGQWCRRKVVTDWKSLS